MEVFRQKKKDFIVFNGLSLYCFNFQQEFEIFFIKAGFSKGKFEWSLPLLQFTKNCWKASTDRYICPTNASLQRKLTCLKKLILNAFFSDQSHQWPHETITLHLSKMYPINMSCQENLIVQHGFCKAHFPLKEFKSLESLLVQGLDQVPTEVWLEECHV